jgi:hypothetical protein
MSDDICALNTLHQRRMKRSMNWLHCEVDSAGDSVRMRFVQPEMGLFSPWSRPPRYTRVCVVVTRVADGFA